jgi:hypothetical protein
MILLKYSSYFHKMSLGWSLPLYVFARFGLAERNVVPHVGALASCVPVTQPHQTTIQSLLLLVLVRKKTRT